MRHLFIVLVALACVALAGCGTDMVTAPSKEAAQQAALTPQPVNCPIIAMDITSTMTTPMEAPVDSLFLGPKPPPPPPPPPPEPTTWGSIKAKDWKRVARP